MYKFFHITLDQNGRIDNIFTDTYYDPFTSALHEVVKDFKLPVSFIASRIQDLAILDWRAGVYYFQKLSLFL